jgi:outer membrane receptor protein involved in Fe transport
MNHMTDFDSLNEHDATLRAARKPLLSLMLSVVGGALPVGASAQSTAPAGTPQAGAARPPVAASAPAGAASQPQIEVQEITVTASRRREPAREVPMQVDTLSTQQLQQAGAKTLTDYLAEEPGIDVKTTGGAGTAAINIRGISTGDQTASTVSTYVDDVAVGSSNAYGAGATTALDMALLDLNHIEVLRGPQGTLYGAGAMGGLLKYVTNEPETDELSGQVTIGGTVTARGGPGSTVAGIINVPLKEDVAAVRVSAFREHVGGDVNAIGPAAGTHINGGDSTGARVSLLIEPSNRLKLRLTATGQNTQRDGADYVDYDPSTGQPENGAATRKLAVREPYYVKVGVAAADIEYDFGWAVLNSITSTQGSRFVQQSDLTYVYGPAVGADLVVANLNAHVRKTTQEFRLTSRAHQPVEWVLGGYYDHEVASNHQSDTAETEGDLLAASLPSTYLEKAVYGDLTWNVTPKLALTGGMRLARNNQKFEAIGSGLLLGGSEDLPGTSADSSKTYLATAKYTLTPTSNVYVRIASGYRPGGPNAVIYDNGVAAAPPVFRPDTLWSYEAGYKADLFDKTLSLQSAIYDIRWNDIQQYTAVNGVNVITNGGKASVQGLELSATWKPQAQLTLVGALSYNDARLTQAAPGLAASGAELPNNARFSANLAANYGFSLAGHTAYAGVSEHIVGDRNAGFEGNDALPAYRLPRYSLTDIQAGVEFERFQVGLFVRNLFDKRAQLGAETNLVAAGVGGPALVNEARPITFGTTLTAKF